MNHESMNGHGLLLKPIQAEEYVFGGRSKLDSIVLQEDRDWRPFVPKHQEIQNANGVEPYACTNFGTANGIETLVKRNYAFDFDYSDRWFAKASGTDPYTAKGNDPHTVAEFARDWGLVLESQWTFDSYIDSLEKFYAPFPKVLWTMAVAFMAQFEFKHEWVPSDANALYDALQFSPLGFSAYAWTKDGDRYYRPDGFSDNHWVECVYAKKDEYWLILDSYKDNNTLYKKIAWDSIPMRAKRYQIKEQTDTSSVAWMKFKAYLYSQWPF